MNKHKPPHPIRQSNKLALCKILLTLALIVKVETASIDKLIDHTISIQPGQKVNIFDTTENILYGIDTEQYTRDIKYLKKKISIMVDTLPQQNLPKHIIQLENFEYIVIFKSFVTEQECEDLCKNTDTITYNLQVARKLNNIPETCKQLNVQMSMTRNRFGVICTEKNKSTMNEDCFNNIDQSARKLNLQFYKSITELKYAMEYNKLYTLLQNSTHYLISSDTACCSCFGNKMVKDKEKDIVGRIYNLHRHKMKQAATNRVKRIQTDVEILESLLESLSYKTFDTEGILDITDKNTLIKELKNSYFKFVQPKKGHILLKQDDLYPDLIDLWELIKLNNTDEEFYQDLRKVEYEKLSPIYLSYLSKIFANANLKLSRHLSTYLASTDLAPNLDFPILYKKDTKLDDVVFQIEKYTNKISTYAIKEFLKFFEFIKLDVSRSVRRLTGIYLTNVHYRSKNPPKPLSDSIEYINNEINPTISMQDTAHLSNNAPDTEPDPHISESELISLLQKHLGATKKNMPKDFGQKRHSPESNRINESTKQNRNKQKNKKRNRKSSTLSSSSIYRYPSTTSERTHTNWASKPLRDTNNYNEQTSENNLQELNQLPPHMFLLTRDEYDIITQLNLSAYHTPHVPARQIPSTHYIFKRMKNRDKNKDGFLDLSELRNFESLTNVLNFYSEGIMNYLISYYGKTKQGSLTITEFFKVSKILEKILSSRTNHGNTDESITTIKPSTGTSSTTTLQQIHSTKQHPNSPGPKILDNTNSHTQPTTLTNIPTTVTTTTPTPSTSSIHGYITTTTTSKHTHATSTETPHEKHENENHQAIFTTPTTIDTTVETPQTTHDILQLIDQENFDQIPSNYESYNRRKRSILNLYQRLQYLGNNILQSKNPSYLGRQVSTPADFPETKTIDNKAKKERTIRKKRSANILTPWYAWWTGLASQRSIESISKDENTIKQNEEIFRARVINLTNSDDVFRKEIKNITYHISNLLGQSSNLSDSFLKMLDEEKDIEEKITFIIKSLGQVVHLSIQIENLLFHLTSLQGEITTHLTNINNILTGTSILNEDLFHRLQAHGTQISPATYNNVEYLVYFQNGIYQIKAKYKLLLQTFTEYRILSLPYVIGHSEGQISIVKLDVHPTIIMNDEREIIHPDELETCEYYKSNYLCNVKNMKFRRQMDTCEADIISKLKYGKPGDLSLCKDKLTYVNNILNHQEYRQSKHYVLLLSDFADVAHWRCQNATEDTHIEPFKLMFIPIVPECILETSVYRIYIQQIEDLVNIDPEFTYKHDDLVDEMLIPMLKNYNFTEGFQEISDNILHASMNLDNEKKSISDLTEEQGHLHANDLGKLLLKPWTIQEKTTTASTASVIAILTIISIFAIGIIICCCYCCTVLFPIYKCCCIPFKACRTYAKTKNKQAAYAELKRKRKDFKQRTRNKSTLQNWIESSGDHISGSEIEYDRKWDKFVHRGRNGDDIYFDYNDIYTEDSRGLHQIDKMTNVPIQKRHRLRNFMTSYHNERREKTARPIYKPELAGQKNATANKTTPEHRTNRITNAFTRNEPTYAF